MGHALQVAKNQGSTEPLGQVPEFFVDQRGGLEAIEAGIGRRRGAVRVCRYLSRLHPSSIRPGPGADATGDPVKPRSERTLDPDATCLANQNQEHCLEGVFDVVRIAQRLAADVEDHRPVPRDQYFKGRLIPMADEAFQHLPVRQSRERSLVKHPYDLP